MSRSIKQWPLHPMLGVSWLEDSSEKKETFVPLFQIKPQPACLLNCRCRLEKPHIGLSCLTQEITIQRRPSPVPLPSWASSSPHPTHPLSRNSCPPEALPVPLLAARTPAAVSTKGEMQAFPPMQHTHWPVQPCGCSTSSRAA